MPYERSYQSIFSQSGYKSTGLGRSNIAAIGAGSSKSNCASCSCIDSTLYSTCDLGLTWGAFVQSGIARCASLGSVFCVHTMLSCSQDVFSYMHKIQRSSARTEYLFLWLLLLLLLFLFLIIVHFIIVVSLLVTFLVLNLYMLGTQQHARKTVGTTLTYVVLMAAGIKFARWTG